MNAADTWNNARFARTALICPLKAVILSPIAIILILGNKKRVEINNIPPVTNTLVSKEFAAMFAAFLLQEDNRRNECQIIPATSFPPAALYHLYEQSVELCRTLRLFQTSHRGR